jgi:hypothetical protein
MQNIDKIFDDVDEFMMHAVRKSEHDPFTENLRHRRDARCDHAACDA